VVRLAIRGGRKRKGYRTTHGWSNTIRRKVDRSGGNPRKCHLCSEQCMGKGGLKLGSVRELLRIRIGKKKNTQEI